MKSMVENRGRWDAGFRSPLLRFRSELFELTDLCIFDMLKIS